jgi:hypothetical protein
VKLGALSHLFLGVCMIVWGSGFVRLYKDPEMQAIWMKKYGRLLSICGWIVAIAAVFEF